MNTYTLLLGAAAGAIAGYFAAGLGDETRLPAASAPIAVPEAAIELTKCVPGMGYHWADPAELPRGPIYLRDGNGEVVGLEYLLLEGELEGADGAGQEFLLDAYEKGFTNVSLAYEKDGLGEIPAPLYALHLYAKSPSEREDICEGEELEPEHHADAADTAGHVVGENAIAVSDQPDGSEVTISLATLAEDGYVVIHEVADGAPGAIIGVSALLEAGTHNNVAAALDEAPAGGTELIAMLHTDNGDGEFNPADDAPVVEHGDIIMMSFTLDSEAQVPADVSI